MIQCLYNLFPAPASRIGAVTCLFSIIIEYLDRHYPGRTRLVPADGDEAWQMRLRDRFYDLYVHAPMQKIVGDRMRPAAKKDPHGVAEAKARLLTAYGMIDRQMATGTWAMGDAFGMADCAAAPSLFYADQVLPFGATNGNVTAYVGRLAARPSFARVVRQAEPYFICSRRRRLIERRDPRGVPSPFKNTPPAMSSEIIPSALSVPPNLRRLNCSAPVRMADTATHNQKGERECDS